MYYLHLGIELATGRAADALQCDVATLQIDGGRLHENAIKCTNFLKMLRHLCATYDLRHTHTHFPLLANRPLRRELMAKLLLLIIKYMLIGSIGRLFEL